MLKGTITFTGKTLGDIDIAIEKVRKRIAAGNTGGFDHNEDGGFDFDVNGEQEDEASTRFTAHFRPEAWVNDNAVTVDAEGPTEWDCTAYLRLPENAATLQEVVEVLGDVDDEWQDDDDLLFSDPAAPEWVRNWKGPFTITVEADN